MKYTDPIPSSPGRGADPLDRMLSAFFRSEMPNPWPLAPGPVRNLSVPAPAPEADRPRRLGPSSPYFSMAAAVTLLLAGYAWLAGQFPQPQDASPPGSRGPLTGWQERRRPLEGVAPLPHGGTARFREEPLPNGGVRIHVEESTRPSPPR